MGNAEYMGTHPIFESDFDCLTEFVGFVENMSEKITRVLITYDNSSSMECKYTRSSDALRYFTEEEKNTKHEHEWMEKADAGNYYRLKYTLQTLPSHIGLYFERGVHNGRIFYEKMDGERFYLYHAKDGDEYRWFISRGIPFAKFIFKSEPSTSYQPPTTMGNGPWTKHIVLELLTDKDDAKHNTAPEKADSYFEINRVKKVNKQYSDKIADLEKKLALAEEKLSVNKTENTASEPKKARSSA